MSQTRIEYTSQKSSELAKAGMSEYQHRQETYARDMIALSMVQESRRFRPGEASQVTWFGLYGKRAPYRAVMRNGAVVLT